MADTNFVNNVTLTDAAWFNDVNHSVYDLLGNGTTAPTTAADVITNLGISSLPSGIGPLPFSGSSVPTGWLSCDGSAISRATYASLFTAIGTTWGSGDGSTTFNIPDMRGSIPVGSGTGTVTVSGVDADVTIASDTFTLAANNTKWTTGMPVVFTLASGTITGLVSTTTYYIIRNNSTTVKLASSLANAQNGTAIDLTAKSTPVWTLTYSMTARTLGEQGGEEAHAMSSTELLSHTHTHNAFNNGGAFVLQGGAATGYQSATINATGGNVAMNIMQPFKVVLYIIKT